MSTPAETNRWTPTTGQNTDVMSKSRWPSLGKSPLFFLNQKLAARGAPIVHEGSHGTGSLSLIPSLCALFSFVLLSSLSPTSDRSPVDKNRKEIGEGCKSRERYEMQSNITTAENDKLACFWRSFAHFVSICCLSAKFVGLVIVIPHGDDVPGVLMMWDESVGTEAKS